MSPSGMDIETGAGTPGYQAGPGAILVRYGEIGLKGRNRPFFEDLLARRLREALEGRLPAQVQGFRGRLLVRVAPEHVPEALARLAKVFGVVALHPTFIAPQDLEQIKAAALAALDSQGRGEGDVPVTFKVSTRRSDKNFPLNSMAVNQEVGAHLLATNPGGGLRVDVHRPQIEIGIEIRDGTTYVYAGGVAGPGGLPVGASSPLIMLLSGGIDSPVAMWLLMKRGAQPTAVHFHSPPFTSERALTKVKDLCRILASWGGPIPLQVVPFTDIQKAIHESVSADLGITVMRRFMFRIAARLAARTGALALATGESLGQVASQTLESMATISGATDMPVLRPLIGMDKSEIMDLAQQIGTYETSILPYEDCCSLFVPRHPRTKPHPYHTERAEARLPGADLIAAALARTETYKITADDGPVPTPAAP